MTHTNIGYILNGERLYRAVEVPAGIVGRGAIQAFISSVISALPVGADPAIVTDDDVEAFGYTRERAVQ